MELPDKDVEKWIFCAFSNADFLRSDWFGSCFLFSLVCKNGVIQHKPNYTLGSDRILCDEAGLNSIAGTEFCLQRNSLLNELPGYTSS